MSSRPVRLGIVSALHEEQAGLIEAMQGVSSATRGMRQYTEGNLWGMECICVLSRVGKVAAAATVATLIERFGVTHVVFTGVAGSAHAGVNVGDIIVAESLVQHDMNAAPLFPRYEVPLIGQSHFVSDVHMTDALASASENFTFQDFRNLVAPADRDSFRLGQPIVHRGLVASADEFINSRHRLAELKTAFPDLLAVEMEGAAVAQVCFEFGVPFAVVRTISDNANEDAPVDFLKFVERVAARYAFGIVKRLCSEWKVV
jgi:adenosylhomocysteine nucleosidase